MMRTNAFTRMLPVPVAWTLLVVLALISLSSLSGCGKKGYPVPRDTSRSFTWEKVDAKIVGTCLAFTGVFEGAYQNFDGIRLEVAPVSGPDDCPGCPFVAREVTEISPREAGFDRDRGTIAFSYCPQPANAYRWRLAGISRFNRLPHAVMTDRFIVVNRDAFPLPGNNK